MAEEVLEEIIDNLYKDLEIEFEKTGKEYNSIDIYEQTCGILTEMFTRLDADYSWEFTPKYDSMKDLYDKSNVK